MKNKEIKEKPVISEISLFHQSKSTLAYAMCLVTLTLISYNRYNGIATNTSVITSGGVIIAATSIIIKKACLRYFAKTGYEMNPIFAILHMMTGSWKTIPITNVSVANVST